MGWCGYYRTSQFFKEKIRAVPVIGERLAEHTKVVFNGIDVRIAQDEEKSSILRHNLGLESHFPIIVNVGRVEEAKGQIDLVVAASEVIHSFPQARFLIVGDFVNDAGYYETLKNKKYSAGIYWITLFLLVSNGMQLILLLFLIF